MIFPTEDSNLYSHHSNSLHVHLQNETDFRNLPKRQEKNLKSVINVGSDVTDVTFGWMFQVTLFDVGGRFARLDELNLDRLVSLRETDPREKSRTMGCY